MPCLRALEVIGIDFAGPIDVGDVDVSKNENDGGNTANDDNRSDEDKNSDSAVEPDKS